MEQRLRLATSWSKPRNAAQRSRRNSTIDPVEAETVRLIFKLYLHGDGSSGALGVKEIVKWLNARGYRTRRGKTFGVGSLHKLLTNTVYIGRWKFNQTSSKTRERKPDEEVVEIPVPAIIDPECLRAGPATAACTQSKSVATAGDDWPNSADWTGRVCNLRRRR